MAFLNTSTDLGMLAIMGLVPLLHHKSLQCLFLIRHHHNHMTYFHSQKIQMKVALMTIRTHNPHLMSSPQHVLCTDPEEISDKTLDAADVMDVDVFEELQQYSDQCSTVTIPNQGRIGSLNAAAIPDQKDMEFDIDEEILLQTN